VKRAPLTGWNPWLHPEPSPMSSPVVNVFQIVSANAENFLDDDVRV